MTQVSSLSLFCCSLPSKMALRRYFIFPRPPSLNDVKSTMGWWRDTVAGLARSLSCLSKMPHCVVVSCNNQAKKKGDPSVRFQCFPEKPELYHALVNAVKRTTLLKDPHVCSRHFERSYSDKSDGASVDGIKPDKKSAQTWRDPDSLSAQTGKNLVVFQA